MPSGGADVADLYRSKELLESFVSTLEPGEYTGPDAAKLVLVLSQLENLASAAKMMAAKRVQETRIHETSGHRDAGSFIADLTGEAVGKTRGSLELAHAAESHPEISEALKQGKLSQSQLKVIASAAAINPDRAADLVETATEKTFGELADACKQVKSADLSGLDGKTRYDTMKPERFLRTWVDLDGFGHIHGKLMADQLGIVQASLQPFVDELRKEARKNDDHQTHDQYAADALVELAKAACGGSDTSSKKGRGPRAHLLLRADWNAIARGHANEGEVCEVVGVGPVPVSLAVEYAHDALLDLVIMHGTKVDTVVTDRRHISRVLKIAVYERDRKCSQPGCNVTFPLEIDHIQDFADGGPTREENLALLCKNHHDLKTYGGWTWDTEHAERRLVPPKGAPPPIDRTSLFDTEDYEIDP